MRQSLVIGASGLVGEHLVSAVSSKGRNPVATYFRTPIPSGIPLDISKKTEVEKLFTSTEPELVYLPAALTNVDYCELHPIESYKINVFGVQNVVNAANATGSRLVYFSTDYIFDGQQGPYDEAAAANPISEYGRQKLSAEHHIALFAENYLIIRTTIIYGWERQGKNFVYRLIKALRENLTVKVPIDQIGSPTYVNNLAKIAVEFSNSDLRGVINVAGPDCLSRYQFACAVAQAFGLNNNLIIPVKTEELTQAAKRPMVAGLKISKALTTSETPIANYVEGLAEMAKERESL